MIDDLSAPSFIQLFISKQLSVLEWSVLSGQERKKEQLSTAVPPLLMEEPGWFLLSSTFLGIMHEASEWFWVHWLEYVALQLSFSGKLIYLTVDITAVHTLSRLNIKQFLLNPNPWSNKTCEILFTYCCWICSHSPVLLSIFTGYTPTLFFPGSLLPVGLPIAASIDSLRLE